MRFVLLDVVEEEAFGAEVSLTMVDVDEDRLKVLARGARWVSLSFLVSFQDMAATIQCGSGVRIGRGCGDEVVRGSGGGGC
jgi:hypothetical protein